MASVNGRSAAERMVHRSSQLKADRRLRLV
jgi:hypothetical protein